MVKAAMQQQITIGHLYPRQMNVYGDMGNILTLQYRLTARNIGVKYVPMESLSTLVSQKIDIIVGGGGQDSNQELIQGDLHAHGEELRAQCQDGLVGFMVCGMYQLLGKSFILADKSVLKGVGVFDLETYAGDERLIGNLVVQSDFGMLLGFENHSGRTYLSSSVQPLGKVMTGAGNNGQDHTEGAIAGNVFGTYLHGPGLAKNPILCDELITRALNRKYGTLAQELLKLDDTLEDKTRKKALKRPR